MSLRKYVPRKNGETNTAYLTRYRQAIMPMAIAKVYRLSRTARTECRQRLSALLEKLREVAYLKENGDESAMKRVWENSLHKALVDAQGLFSQMSFKSDRLRYTLLHDVEKSIGDYFIVGAMLREGKVGGLPLDELNDLAISRQSEKAKAPQLAAQIMRDHAAELERRAHDIESTASRMSDAFQRYLTTDRPIRQRQKADS